MHTPERNDDENRLSDLLQRWSVEPADDPGFARKVWARIEGRPSTRRTIWQELVAGWLATRAALAVTVATFALMGGLAAAWQARVHDDSHVNRLAAEYVRSIDPVQMTSSAQHIHP